MNTLKRLIIYCTQFNINNIKCNKVAYIHKHLVCESYLFAEALFHYKRFIN